MRTLALELRFADPREEDATAMAVNVFNALCEGQESAGDLYVRERVDLVGTPHWVEK